MKYRLVIVFPLLLGCTACLAAQPKQNKRLKILTQQLIDLTNQARKKEKLSPLTANAKLFKVAQDYSQFMAKAGKAGHFVDGGNPAKRVLAGKYNYLTCGENVGEYRLLDVRALFDAWMNSPIHRREILRKEYEEIGIGIAYDRKTMKYYYTQVFGTEIKKKNK